MPAEYPQRLVDIRVYQPRMLPNAKQAAYVGKPVHVVWQQPVFSLFGGGGKDGPLHELVRWYGYVIEFDRQIPDDELVRQTRLPAPKGKK